MLICGPAVRPKSILKSIDDLWQGKYGLGFTKLVVIRHGLRAGVSYLCKYLTKQMRRIYRYKRIFSASKGALAPMSKPKFLKSEVYFGEVSSDNDGKPVIRERVLDVEDLVGGERPLEVALNCFYNECKMQFLERG